MKRIVMASSSSTKPSSEDLRKVIDESVKIQQQLGDCSNDAASQLPRMGKLKLKLNELDELKEIWWEWSAERRHQFILKYGELGSLMYVNVEKQQLLDAMILFWDPSYRCFTFNEVDLTPTIEEYFVLLKMPELNYDKVYWYEPKSGLRKKLAKIMNIHADGITHHVKQKGETQCVSAEFLCNFIRAHQNDDCGMSVMALAIYGLVIFPKVRGYVDGGVIKFFAQVEHGVNPVPAILAETFRSLNYCRKAGEGSFLGCAPLLYIWMMSHFKFALECPFTSPLSSTKSPISEFGTFIWPGSLPKQAWIENFQTLTSQDVLWKAPWMALEHVIYRCGEYHWVPLLGPWGGTSYAPAMVRRQAGSIQFVPVTYGLDQLEFCYSDEGATKLVKLVVDSWKQARRVKFGRYTNDATPGYSTWHAMRRRGSMAPRVYGPNLPTPVPVDPEDYQMEMEARYELANQSLKAENSDLAHENQKLREELDQWKNQTRQATKRTQKLHRFINSLALGKRKMRRDNARMDSIVQDLRSRVKWYEDFVATLQLEISSKKEELIETTTLSLDLQASVDELNQQVSLQHEMIQALEAECERLGAENQDMDRMRGEYVRLYSQAERMAAILRKVASTSKAMAAKVEEVHDKTVPGGVCNQELINFLEDLHCQFDYVGRFY